jgi:thioredoxin reductase (NADPH)
VIVATGARYRRLDAVGVEQFESRGVYYAATELEARACAGSPASHPGLFAVGDVRSGSTKRVAAAVGEGSAAVRSVHDYLGFDRHA